MSNTANDDLTWFSIDESNVIYGDDLFVARTRADAYSIHASSLTTLSAKAGEADEVTALKMHIYWLLHEEVEDEIDPEEAALDLLRQGTVEDAAEILRSVHEWIDEEPDDEDAEASSEPTTTGDAAYRYFRDTERDLSLIGVEVIEGEFPGSTFYAARLRWPIEAANEAAERLGWPERSRVRPVDAKQEGAGDAIQQMPYDEWMAATEKLMQMGLERRSSSEEYFKKLRERHESLGEEARRRRRTMTAYEE